MKLLFDQNLSFRVIKEFSDTFPEARHVGDLGLLNSTDMEIWEYAKSNDYSIVTFDSDFYDLSVIKGCPPKIIWLRIGNTSTNRIASILEEEINLIRLFLYDSNYKEISCLEID